MSVLEAIVLGIVQGLTEFLPISSTGHLRIVPAFLGWEDPGAAFTAVTQLGTVAAVLIYFRHDLVRVALTWTRSLRDPSLRGDIDARMGWILIIGTIPIAIFGFAFSDSIEGDARNLYVIGTTLIVLGLVLYAAEHLAQHRRPMEDAQLRDGWLVGLAQALALIPGVSRSGSTLTMGLFLGFERAAAARFSFLLSIPAVVLSGLYQLGDAVSGDTGAGTGAVLIATIFAFISGYAAIAFLLRFLQTHTTLIFIVYRVVVGALVLVLAGSGAIS